MIYNERNNNSGVLYPTGKDNKAKKDRSESNFVASLDPVLKDLYANLMDSQDGHDYEAQEGHRDGHHDDDGHHGSEARYEDDAYQDDASIGTPINIDESDGESASVGGTNEGEQSKSIVRTTFGTCSTRGWCTTRGCSTTEVNEAKKPKIKSPWIRRSH
ncbi:hypothetical protein K1719_040666 [Acacia pycnantha]|nr:hypothetical protein K1719_040666 [Acacia pycnantha]